MNSDDSNDIMKMKWILFWVFITSFCILLVGTIVLLFTGYGKVTDNERSLLVKIFVGEVGMAVIVLFYSIFDLKKKNINKSNIVKTDEMNELSLRYNNSVIKILFGDLFQFEGFKVIPASRFLFETRVIESSLQNKIIKQFLTSHEGDEGMVLYNQQLEKSLEHIEYK